MVSCDGNDSTEFDGDLVMTMPTGHLEIRRNLTIHLLMQQDLKIIQIVDSAVDKKGYQREARS